MNNDFVSETYQISTDKSKLNLEVIHKFLSEEAYWSKNIPFEIVKKSIENSFCFGVYYNNEQIGFARLITDYATYAYLADVFILHKHRGKGLSKMLMSEIINHPELQYLRRISLATSDAHGLYEQFGFKPPSKPGTLMEIYRPDIYQ